MNPSRASNMPLQRSARCKVDRENANAKALQMQKIFDQTHGKLCS